MNRLPQFLFLMAWMCCLGMQGYAAEKPSETKGFADQLIQNGLTPDLEAKLLSKGGDSLASIARTYFLKENNYSNFDKVLTFFEKPGLGQDVLCSVYAKLLLGRKEDNFRIRLFRSICQVMPETGKVFLEAELDRNESKILNDVLSLYSMYQDPKAVSFVMRFLSHKDTVRAAVIALGKMKGKQSISLLIQKMKKADSDLQQDIASALKNITGYEFGARSDIWNLWWKKYGSLFEVKRFVRDFRKVHTVKDYSPLEKALFSFFLESVRADTVLAWEPVLNADEYIERIIAEPKKWRGVLFALKGEIKDVEELEGEGCSIVSIILYHYPRCHVIVPGSVSRKGERGVFKGVFYKLRRGGRHLTQPLLIFTGRQLDTQDTAEEEIEYLIQKFSSSDPEIRKKLREQVTCHGEKAVPYLVNAVRTHKDTVVRSTALIVLAEISPADALPVIEEYIISDDILLRVCAELALSNIFEKKPKERNRETHEKREKDGK